eukprot:9498769-Pyramimonas_sp.AAC.1
MTACPKRYLLHAMHTGARGSRRTPPMNHSNCGGRNCCIRRRQPGSWPPPPSSWLSRAKRPSAPQASKPSPNSNGHRR